MTRTDETARTDGMSRRRLLQSGAAGFGAVGLAGCPGGGESREPDAPGTDAPQDAPPPELDLETLESDTEFGTLQAQRAENSYVGLIDDGRAIGIAFLDEVGAGEDDEVVVHLYDGQSLAIMLGEVDAAGTATLESEELSDFEATADLVVEEYAATGTVTFADEEPTEFAADAATGVAGVYWAHGTDEEPDASGDWVVLADGRQWGCVCPPPFVNPCCHLRQ